MTLNNALHCESCGRDFSAYTLNPDIYPGAPCPITDDCPSHHEEKGLLARADLAPAITVVFAVTVHGTDFGGDLSEAATWLESRIDNGAPPNSRVTKTDVTAYRNAQDAAADERDRDGHWLCRAID